MKLYLLFMIINMLSGAQAKTAEQIGYKLEISGRSVLRYIDELEIMGVPVIRMRGRSGGFLIDEKHHINFNVLTNKQRRFLMNLLSRHKSDEAQQILCVLRLTD